MAYWRTIWKGAIGGVEVWSTSINWGIFGPAPDVPNQTDADGILAALRTAAVAGWFPASLKSLMSTSLTITAIRVELRSESEHILSVAEGLLPSAVPGLGTASKTPQDALVVSMRSNTPGAKGRGRMYWPAIGATLNASFQLNSPTAATVVADARTWLNAIGGVMNSYYIGIASALRVVLSVRSVVDHVCRDIVSLQVGSVLDTQRRRRDALPETYVGSPYP